MCASLFAYALRLCVSRRRDPLDRLWNWCRSIGCFGFAFTAAMHAIATPEVENWKMQKAFHVRLNAIFFFLCVRRVHHNPQQVLRPNANSGHFDIELDDDDDGLRCRYHALTERNSAWFFPLPKTWLQKEWTYSYMKIQSKVFVRLGHSPGTDHGQTARIRDASKQWDKHFGHNEQWEPTLVTGHEASGEKRENLILVFISALCSTPSVGVCRRGCSRPNRQESIRWFIFIFHRPKQNTFERRKQTKNFLARKVVSARAMSKRSNAIFTDNWNRPPCTHSIIEWKRNVACRMLPFEPCAKFVSRF